MNPLFVIAGAVAAFLLLRKSQVEAGEGSREISSFFTGGAVNDPGPKVLTSDAEIIAILSAELGANIEIDLAKFCARSTEASIGDFCEEQFAAGKISFETAKACQDRAATFTCSVGLAILNDAKNKALQGALDHPDLPQSCKDVYGNLNVARTPECVFEGVVTTFECIANPDSCAPTPRQPVVDCTGGIVDMATFCAEGNDKACDIYLVNQDDIGEECRRESNAKILASRPEEFGTFVRKTDAGGGLTVTQEFLGKRLSDGRLKRLV